MTTLMPEGDDLRKAVKWIAAERSSQPQENLAALIAAACLKFDLSPVDADFLLRTLQGVRSDD